MASESIEVEIAGQRFNLNCPVGEGSLLTDAVLELNRQIHLLEKRTSVKNRHLLVVVAALNLCKELCLARSEQKRLHAQLSSLIHQLDSQSVDLKWLSRKGEEYATIQ